jgi:putative hydrolase of the HAD superfamily
MSVVVFDLDDTLYPESAFVESALRAVAEHAEQHLGLDGFEARCAALRRAGTKADLFQSVLADLCIPMPHDAIINDLLCAYRSHAPQSLPWHDDARSALEYLKGVADLGLISDGYLPTQELKAQALGLSRYIPDPIFTERLGRSFWKPHPRAFELIMQRFPGETFTYVGDNPFKDFAAPRALGWRTVRVRRSGGVYAELASGQDSPPDIEVPDLSGLEWVVAN